MTDAEIRAELQALGVDESSWRAVLLLPLVQVAWADGVIQDEERVLILDVARQRLALDEAALAVVEHWLCAAPTAEVIERGRRLMVQLALRHRGPGSELSDNALEAVQALCESVARAAGGLFGVLFTVDKSERAALAEIASSVDAERARLVAELPGPSAGWEDLPTYD